MKFVVGFFLSVLTVVLAAPFEPKSHDLTAVDFEDFLSGLAFATEEDGRVEDDQSHLKDRLEYILEKIKEAIDDGRAVKEDLLTKLKEIKGKLKTEVGEKAKKLLHKIKESGRNYLKNILKGLGLSKRDIEERSDTIFENEQTSLEEVQKQLKERLDEVLKKIKDAIDQGKAVKKDMINKMKELQKKMKDMNLEVGKKSKDILEKIKEKGRDILKDILEKLGLGHRAAEEEADAIMLLAESESNHIKNLKEKFNEFLERVKESLEGSKSIEDILEKFRNFRGKQGNKRSADIDIFGMIDQLKDLVKEKFNPDRLKQIVEKYLGKGSEAAEQLINALKEKGAKRKQKILEWIDRIFKENQEEKRSIKDEFMKIKDYFKDLGIVLKEKYFRFGQWVKGQYEKGLQKGKDELENVKKIAEEFLKDTKENSKGVAREALNFFKEYEQDLGNIFNDLKEKIQDILTKKDR